MHKKLIALAIVLTLFNNKVFSQDFSYSNIVAESASYSGGNLTIRLDNSSGTYTAPHYTNGATDQKPVAYVSGMTPQVTCDFSFTCAAAPDSIYIKGVAPEGMEFPAKKVIVNNVSAGEYAFSYPVTSADMAFAPSVARYFHEFAVGWDVSFDEGTTWRNADSTKNTFYITHTTPMAETGDFKYWRTIYDISCRNTDGLNTETDIIAGIWTDFTDQEMLNWQGDSLKYYNPMYTFNTSLSALLTFNNAQCYTFAKLFLATIKIQGIVRTGNYVYITPIGNSVCGNSVNRFLVKNWEFGAPSASGECASFPYKNTYTSLLPFPFTSYNFDTEDVSDMVGIYGQGSANPSSFFNNHQICYIDGVYYDPSYGVSFPTFADISITAFDGWGYRYSVGSVTHCLFTDDLSLSSLTSSVTTY